jgi:hypothetical protein
MSSGPKKPSLPNLSDLSSAMQSPVRGDVDDAAEYRRLQGVLPQHVMLGGTSDVAVEPDFSTGKQHWSLCQMPEGDYPRVAVYRNLGGLVEAIAKLDGSETAVWAVYGVPLRLTKTVATPQGPVRYLLLPDNLAAVVSLNSSKLQVVSRETLPVDLEWQEEGWLGDPAAVESSDYFVPGYETDAGVDVGFSAEDQIGPQGEQSGDSDDESSGVV